MKKITIALFTLATIISCSKKVVKSPAAESIPAQNSSQTTTKTDEKSPITLFDGEIKIGGLGLNDLYYGFAEGDKIILSIKESNGRQIPDVYVFSYPLDTVYKERLVKEISNKEISVLKTGVYYFKFSNAFGEGRIYNVKIQRAFTNKKYASFNSKVLWRKDVDTVWHSYPARVVVKSDTILNTLVDEAVSLEAAVGNTTKHKSFVTFNLPNLTKGYAFYIGTEPNGKNDFNKLNDAFQSSPSFNKSKIIQNGILAEVILRNKNIVTNSNCIQPVKYVFMESVSDANNFVDGKYFSFFRDTIVCNESKKMSYPSNGQICIGFKNENTNTPLSVYVNVAAVTINEQYETKQVKKFRLVDVQRPYLTN